MIQIEIPGYKRLMFEHLVLDYNGTLAVDGNLVPGVEDLLTELSSSLRIHVLTADTFGTVRDALQGVPCELSVVPLEDQEIAKFKYVMNLGNGENVVCIGNGRNDKLMMKKSALGIVAVLDEGAAVETLLAADVVCNDILSALRLLTHPKRLTATMRT